MSTTAPMRPIYPPIPTSRCRCLLPPPSLIPPGSALLFVSGCNASPLYHAHPSCRGQCEIKHAWCSIIPGCRLRRRGLTGPT
jgi:hypothetical protein